MFTIPNNIKNRVQLAWYLQVIPGHHLYLFLDQFHLGQERPRHRPSLGQQCDARYSQKFEGKPADFSTENLLLLGGIDKLFLSQLFVPVQIPRSAAARCINNQQLTQELHAAEQQQQ